MNISKLFLVVLSLVSINLFAAEAEGDSKARTEITETLQKWSQDFNSKNIQGACSLFAPDLIASYPGTPNRNYGEMCQTLTSALKDPEVTFRYEGPVIEQVMVEGNLAVVRLIWTLVVTDKNNAQLDAIKERGLDVLKRRSDGSWKIAISYAYPEEMN